jgi:archaetidylinositol phosphate synthase
MGLILSIISAIIYSLHSPSIGANWYSATLIGGIFLIIAGGADAIDGAVARVTNKTSALGSFLDSVIDKVSEIIIFIGVLIGNFTNPVLVLVTLSLSLLVSYTRSKGDSLGIDLKGKGIAERAERIIILAVLSFIPFKENISVALWIISILAIITILERLKIVSEIFGMPLFSIQTLSQIFKREDMSNQNFTSYSNNQNITKYDNNNQSLKDSLNKEKINKIDTKRPSSNQPDFKSNNAPKASYLDTTDPNETGRNVAQLLFDQENEDKKFTDNKSPSTTTTASTANQKKDTGTTAASSTTTTASTANQKKDTGTTAASSTTNTDSTENQKKDNDEQKK